MAIQHKDIPDSQLHEPKGILSAAINQVYASTGGGSGNWVDYAPGFTNIIEVKEVGDFPAPVSGVITPEANTAYFISGSVNITPNVLNLNNPGVALLGFNRSSDALITDFAGPLLSSTNQNLPLTGLTLVNLNASGTLLNLSNTGTNIAILDKVLFGECNSIGTINNYQSVIFDNCGIAASSPIGGIVFSGSDWKEVLVRDSFFSNYSGVMFDLGTTVSDFIEFLGVRFRGDAGSTAISGLPASANIGVLGAIADCIFHEMTTPLSGIDHADSGWFFTSGVGVQPSAFLGFVAMANNLTDTTITTTSQWTKVAGTTVANSSIERFVMSDNNELTFNGLLDRPVDISVSLSAGKSGGGNRVLEFTIFKEPAAGGGFQQLDLNVVALLETDDKPRGASILATDTASPGDKYSVYCRNTTDTSDIEVPTMQFFMRG